LQTSAHAWKSGKRRLSRTATRFEARNSFHVANGKVLPTPMGNDQGGAGESALRRGSGVVGVGGGASRRKTKSTVPLKRQGSGMRSTRAPDAFPAPAGGVVVFRPPRKSSTAWKSNSAVFHAMEVKLCGFPRHGSHFFEKFHGMEPTFVPVVRAPRRTSRRVFPAPRCFHTMEPTFARFPTIGKNFPEATKATKESRVAGGTREECGWESTRTGRKPLRGQEHARLKS